MFESKTFAELFLQDYSFLDVRAPVEFAEGHLPQSINLPLLNDQERHLVGTAYKNLGQEKAIELGHQLVQGEVKALRLQAWTEKLRENPRLLIMCFRGGLRSKVVQEWCASEGVPRARIEGGYKAIRRFLFDETLRFSQTGSLCVVSGATGSGKTTLLRQLRSSRKAVLDLEGFAEHRGSAFGGLVHPQPSQVTFENRLAVAILQLPHQQNVLVEDESRMIGHAVQPECFFHKLRSSPIVLLQEPLAIRVENTFSEYILHSPIVSENAEAALAVFTHYQAATRRIQNRLGGLRCAEILQDLQNSKVEYLQGKGHDAHRLWIRKLLEWYYDPMYFDSLKKRQPKVLMQGNTQEVRQFLLSASQL